SLRLLLEQAGIDAEALLKQAGIDAEQREAADRLQKLILGELHHRIKNTLATVSAIASQSFRTATSIAHGQKAMEGRLVALGRAHVSWTTDDDKQRLRLRWTERGGPPVAPPARRSFGTRMMESLGQQLNGEVQLAYRPNGFVYALDVPLGSVMAPG